MRGCPYNEYDETVTRLATLKVVDITDKTALNILPEGLRRPSITVIEDQHQQKFVDSCASEASPFSPSCGEQYRAVLWCFSFVLPRSWPTTAPCVRPAFPVEEYEPPGVAAENFLRQARQLEPSHASARELRRPSTGGCRGFFVALLQRRSK
jgi:hypothetical protein